MMKPPIRILVADDHPFFTDGLAIALQSLPAYALIAAVNNGNEVIASIESNHPDILILDINMPGINGLELLPIIKKQYPALKIMILSMYLPGDVKLELAKEPIDAYVIKSSGTEVLLEALNQIAAGNRFTDPNIKKSNGHSEDNFSKKLKLSTREKEILQLLVLGLSNKEIADKLFLSDLTIKTHRKNIMKKMEARNLAELILKN